MCKDLTNDYRVLHRVQMVAETIFYPVKLNATFLVAEQFSVSDVINFTFRHGESNVMEPGNFFGQLQDRNDMAK